MVAPKPHRPFEQAPKKNHRMRQIKIFESNKPTGRGGKPGPNFMEETHNIHNSREHIKASMIENNDIPTPPYAPKNVKRECLESFAVNNPLGKTTTNRRCDNYGLNIEELHEFLPNDFIKRASKKEVDQLFII